MKTINYLSLGLFSFALFSCSNENLDELSDQKMVKLTKNEVLSVSYDDAKELSENEVFNIVGAFFNTETTCMTKGVSPSFKITKKTFINREGEFEDKGIASKAVNIEDDITSTINEVEFSYSSNRGLAVVATDAKLPSVIAFIPNEGEGARERTGLKELLHASKASYLYKAIKTKELVDSLRQPTLEKISKELEIPINEISYERIKDNIILTDASAVTKTTAVQGPPAGIQKLPSSIDPLVKTNWGQEDPYNASFYLKGKEDYIRTGNNGKVWGPVPVGCVNVAMAQMMGCAYLKIMPPTFVIPNGGNATFVPNFPSMTQYPSITQLSGSARFNVEYLLLDLYIENNTTSKKAWDGAVTDSEVTEDNMLRTMNKYFKFSPKANFNGDLAWASLRNGNPVLMLTATHAFVLSGILITEKAHQTRQLVKTNDVYWYANLGWANEATGYYQLNGDANTYFEAGGTNEWCYKMEYLNNVHAK